MSIVTKNQIIITSVSLIVTTIFTIIMIIRTVKFTNFKINIRNCIKYDSVYLFAEISMFIIYFSSILFLKLNNTSKLNCITILFS